MIRRRRLTTAQRSLRDYKRNAPISTGESLEEKRAREDAEEAAVITEVREYIWRTRPSCQLCHGARRKDCMGLEDQMHEDPPRSKTRGLPPRERFNLIICGRLCAACHRDVTENRLRVVFSNPALGFLAPVTAEKVA